MACSRPVNGFPPRLHVLLARDSDRAVVIRRGPSKQVCTILWDRNGDRFETGQWMRGRIYERRCDLSPDGEHMIYFAMNGHWKSATGGSWTGISRAPYLRAVVLLGKGDCWHGGGLFSGRRSYWLNDGYGHKAMREAKELTRDTDFVPPGDGFGGECPGVYYPRLLRDGWTLVERVAVRGGNARTIFEKPLAHDWVLRKHAHEQVGAPPGKGCYWDEHELVRDGVVVPKAGWEWAERDRRWLLWAERGVLYRARLDDERGFAEPAVVRDFNGMRFEALAAPYR